MVAERGRPIYRTQKALFICCENNQRVKNDDEHILRLLNAVGLYSSHFRRSTSRSFIQPI
jgi:hypothetical protein